MKTLFAFLLLSGPVIAQTTITVPLEVVNTKHPTLYSQVGTGQSTDLSAFRGVPGNLVEKVLRTANTVRGQASYASFLRGNISQSEWEKTKQGLGQDTTYLSRKPLRHQINTLVGTNTAGQRVLIVDANNNHDFGDDRAFTYPMTLPQIPKQVNGFYDNSIHAVFDTLPAVLVSVEAFDGQQIVQRTVSVKPIPYNTGWTYPDPEQNRFHLSLLANEYRKATTSVLGESVDVLVTTVPGLPYNTHNVTVELREAGKPVNKLLSQGSFQPGYTFILANHVLEITGISQQGDKLSLLDKGVITPTR
ncbi:hypothetical protein J2I47_12205 [Fibrella sp. HMF5335]|uniref:Uncharacterized protein n=1 Tax=Fibrella rubiginis TaxID=2817060 RepID=A0A939GH17_9BACT|nr:hypothetical protein [Fibrella rubiginis]MBO0937310.1 hypothetical protein [Fibrella rubiginis]